MAEEMNRFPTLYLNHFLIENEDPAWRKIITEIFLLSSSSNYDKNYANFLCFIVFPSPQL